MEIVTSAKPLLAVLVSLIGSLLIVCAGKKPNLRESASIVLALLKFGIVASMLPAVLKGKNIFFNLIDVIPGVGIAFRVDALGILFALVASSLWIVTTLYSIGYMRPLREHSQTRYFAFFSLALSAAIGVAFSANLLTLYLFYEMLSLSTYPLVTHHQDEEARHAGRKYLTYLMGTSIAFLLPAVIITYYLTGTLDFTDQGIMEGKGGSVILTIVFFLFIFGTGKAAIMPIHSWLPSAMVAPTPVSALLHAVAVVKVGVFSVLRVCLNIYGIKLMHELTLDIMLLYLISFTIIIGSLFALRQDDLKARLAYSTVSQLSYIVMGGGLLSVIGMTGGIIHIVMHAFGKITLFFCAGAIIVNTGFKKISEMKGIGKMMPVTMAAFFFGSLSIIGIPPFAGFLSKWYLALGSIEAGHLPVLIVILTSSLLNAAYFLPITYNAFFSSGTNFNASTRMREAPVFAVMPPVITALISFGLFVYPEIFIKLAKIAANAAFGN
ncbi:MAG: monovalent cation/H+ antiporter subunit D family protein [Syntrophales bacterium]|jgi:multicomponent Na+:H+ antiporter subunit D|nr:monovalent cation/H+ antiporter subunit D family protein [Syntrophales bacterium]MDY0043275.1 monovalent cation/H+ antiporter subunit D family protein [Syntrophales bacterium]